MNEQTASETRTNRFLWLLAGVSSIIGVGAFAAGARHSALSLHSTLDPPEEILARRIHEEHELMGKSMSWLMTLNGFLLATLGLVAKSIFDLASSPENMDLRETFVFLVLVVCLVGVITNASVLFSNYWASRAIREAKNAYSEYCRTLKRRKDYSKLARLWGSDPAHMVVRPHSFWQPRTKVLHAWHLIPIVFTLAFSMSPVLGVLSYGAKPFSAEFLISFMPVLSLIIFFLLIIAEKVRNGKAVK